MVQVLKRQRLTSAAGCDSLATLNLTVNPEVTSTTDLTICDDLLPYFMEWLDI